MSSVANGFRTLACPPAAVARVMYAPTPALVAGLWKVATGDVESDRLRATCWARALGFVPPGIAMLPEEVIVGFFGSGCDSRGEGWAVWEEIWMGDYVQGELRKDIRNGG